MLVNRPHVCRSSTEIAAISNASIDADGDLLREPEEERELEWERFKGKAAYICGSSINLTIRERPVFLSKGSSEVDKDLEMIIRFL